MARPKILISLLLLCIITNKHGIYVLTAAGNWCVARSDASNQALQTALDYACASGADCSPLQSNGLCYLPNTIQAHTSYAFNSYFQRKNMAPGSCDFSGTATIAQTDPSYGSCVYPSSPSTAGGTPTSTTPTTSATNPSIPMTPTTTSPLSGDGSNGLNPGITTPTFTPPDNSKAFSLRTLTKMLVPASCLLLLSFTLQTMVVL